MKIRLKPMTNGEYIRRSESRQQDNHTRRQAAKKLGGNGGQR
jgi:hypothetical protein